MFELSAIEKYLAGKKSTIAQIKPELGSEIEDIESQIEPVELSVIEAYLKNKDIKPKIQPEIKPKIQPEIKPKIQPEIKPEPIDFTKPMGDLDAIKPKSQEEEFQLWYQGISEIKNLNPDPDTDESFYDYRKYYEEYKDDPQEMSRILNPEEHFTSTFKREGHPTQYVPTETPHVYLNTINNKEMPEIDIRNQFQIDKHKDMISTEQYYGLFQHDKLFYNHITGNKIENFTPKENIAFAKALFDADGWNNFVGFKNNKYKEYLNITDGELLDSGIDVEILKYINQQFSPINAKMAKAVMMGGSSGNAWELNYIEDRALMSNLEKIASDIANGIPLDMVFSSDPFDALLRDFPKEYSKIQQVRNKIEKAQEKGAPDFVITEMTEKLDNELADSIDANRLVPATVQQGMQNSLDRQGTQVEKNNKEYDSLVEKYEKSAKNLKQGMNNLFSTEDVEKLKSFTVVGDDGVRRIKSNITDIVKMGDTSVAIQDTDPELLQLQINQQKALDLYNNKIDEIKESEKVIDAKYNESLDFFNSYSATAELFKNSIGEVKQMTGNKPVDEHGVVKDAIILYNTLIASYEGFKQNLPATVASAIRRKRDGKIVNLVDTGVLDKTIAQSREFQDFLIASNPYYNEKIFGTFFTSGKIQESFTNLPFSLVTMSGTWGGKGGTTALLKGLTSLGGGWVSLISSGVALATGGKIAYNVDQNQFIRDQRDLMLALDPESTEEDWDRHYELMYGSSVKHGLWEAIPEALGNLMLIKLWELPTKVAIPIIKNIENTMVRKMSAVLLSMTGTIGEELVTETITQFGQSGIEALTGLRDKLPENKWLRIKQAYLEIYPQVILTTMALGGANTSVRFLSDKIKGVEPETKHTIRAKKQLPKIENLKIMTALEDVAPPLSTAFIPVSPEQLGVEIPVDVSKAKLDAERELEIAQKPVKTPVKEKEIADEVELDAQGMRVVKLKEPKALEFKSTPVENVTPKAPRRLKKGETVVQAEGTPGEFLILGKDGITVKESFYQYDYKGQPIDISETKKGKFVVKLTINGKPITAKLQLDTLPEAVVMGEQTLQRLTSAKAFDKAKTIKTNQLGIDKLIAPKRPIKTVGDLKDRTTRRMEVEKQLEESLEIQGMHEVMDVFSQKGVGDNQVWEIITGQRTLIDELGGNLVEAKQRILESDLADDVDVARVVIHGKNSRELVNDIKKDVIKIWTTGNLSTPIEERVETWAKGQLESDVEFHNKLTDWRNAYEESTGEKAKNKYDTKGNLEWFSTLAVDYVFGADPQGTVHSELRTILDRFKDYAKMLFERAGRLAGFIKEGKVDATLIDALSKSIEEKVTPLQEGRDVSTFQMFESENFDRLNDNEFTEIENTMEELYGFTDKFENAGWINNDGKWLNLFDPKRLPLAPMERNIEHIEIAKEAPKSYLEDNRGNNWDIISALQEKGYIRISSNIFRTGNNGFLEMRKYPNNKQMDSIQRFIDKLGEGKERNLVINLSLPSTVDRQPGKFGIERVQNFNHLKSTIANEFNKQPEYAKIINEFHFQLGTEYFINPKVQVEFATDTPQLSRIRKFDVGKRATLSPIPVGKRPALEGKLRFTSEVYRHEVYDTFNDEHNLMGRKDILLKGHPQNPQSENTYDLDELAHVLQRDFPQYKGFIYEDSQGNIPIEWYGSITTTRAKDLETEATMDLALGTFQISDRKSEVTKIFEKPTIEIEHYSWTTKIQELNPDFYGTRPTYESGVELLRRNDKGFQNRVMVYVAGEKPEMFLQGTMKYKSTLKTTDIYDLINNPENYDQTGNFTKMENEILKYYKGYMGIIDGRLAIAYFDKIPVVRAGNQYNSADSYALGLKKGEMPKPMHLKQQQTTYPLPLSEFPTLRITPLEEALQDLFTKTKTERHPFGSPTVAQIEALPKSYGYPTKSFLQGTKKVHPLDEDVKVIPYSELRSAVISEFKNAKSAEFGFWYSKFGKGFKEIVGKENMMEASIIFGITSAQNSVPANLVNTLFIMRKAREIDPVKHSEKFKKALKAGGLKIEKKIPGQQISLIKDLKKVGLKIDRKPIKMNVTDASIDNIVEMYKTGVYEKRGSIKVTSYMQSVYLKSEDRYIPWIVNDIHMKRAFGFLGLRKQAVGKKGKTKLIDKPITSANQAYMTFMTLKLAQDLDFAPDVIQAVLWKYAREKYGKLDTEGTWEEAFQYASGEVFALSILKDLNKGKLKSFPSLKEENLPHYDEALVIDGKPGKKTLARTNNQEAYDALYTIAKMRAGKISVSFTPGNAFSKGEIPLKIQQEYHKKVMSRITGEDGAQISFLNAMNIPHSIVEHMGSWGAVEQGFDIIFPGNGMGLPTALAPFIGSALMQDAVYVSQMAYDGENSGLAIRKKDGTHFTEQEILSIHSQVNPEQNEDGFNFTEMEDGHSLVYHTEDVETLRGILKNTNVEGGFTFGEVRSNGSLTTQEEYTGKIEEFSRSPYLSGRPDIFRTAENLLFEPIQKTFKEFGQKLNPVADPKFLDIKSFDTANPELSSYQLDEQSGMEHMDDVNEIIDGMANTADETKKGWSFSKMYTTIFDDMNPIHTLVKHASKAEDVGTERDPYVLARMLRGWEGVVEHFLTFGTLDAKRQKNGESFSEIIKDAGGTDKLNAYLIASRGLEVQRNFPEKTLKELTGIKDSVIKHVHKTLDTKKFQDLAQRIYKYQDKLLQFARDNGLLSMEQYAQIKKTNQYYVPFFRSMEEEGTIKKGLGKGLVNVSSGLKHFRGSGRAIINPLESIIKNTYTLVNLSMRNAIGVEVAKLAETVSGSAFIQESKAPFTVTTVGEKELLSKGFSPESIEELEEAQINIFRPSKWIPPEPYVFITIDGKRKYFKLEQELYNSMTSLAPAQFKILLRILSIPASTMRAGATLTGEFMGRNVLRDVVTATIYTKGAIFSPIDFVMGTLSLIAGKTGIGTEKRQEIYRKWKASGADYAMLVSIDREYFGTRLDEPLKTKAQRATKYLNPLHILRAFSSGLEAGTRLGEFGKVLRKEGDGYEGLIKAGYASREVTLDFSRKGIKPLQQMNKITAFFNAQLQGVDKIARQFKKYPVKSTIRALSVITLPSIMLWLANHDDEEYQSIPRWQKDLFWLIKMPEYFKTVNMFGDNFLRIPKPFELGLIFGSLPERILDWAVENDPDGMKEYTKSFVQAFLPDFAPTGVRIIAEIAMNKNFFYDAPIVSPYIELQDISNIYKRRANTSSSAIELTKLMKEYVGIDFSPADLDHLFYGLFAGVGQYVLDMTDYAVDRLTNKELPPKVEVGLADDPIIKGFIAKMPTPNTRWTEKFYNQYDDVANAYLDWKWLKKNSTPEKAEKHYIKYENLITMYKDYKKLGDFMSKIRKAVRAIENDMKMDGVTKKKEIDKLWREMNDMVRNAVEDGHISRPSKKRKPSEESFRRIIKRR